MHYICTVGTQIFHLTPLDKLKSHNFFIFPKNKINNIF